MCDSFENNVLELGEKKKLNDLLIHYYCLVRIKIALHE